MTATAAQPRRAVIDLGAETTILDAAHRLAATDSSELVLVVPAGAPLVRNAVFLDVLRRRAGDRRIVMVSADQRARSLAASVHMPAFASLAALDRHEMDATEHLSDARRAVLATIAAAGAPRGMSVGRAVAVFMSLLLAVGILTAVVAPSATIVMSANTSPLGPSEYDLRAGPNGGDVKAETLRGPITATTKGEATGSRTDNIKALGIERFTNLTTFDIRVQKGTIVRTTDNIRFETTEDRTLPRSTLIPLVISEITISIQAIEAGPRGNVPPQRITVSSSPDYRVTNPVETLGGESKKIAIVQQADYDAAVVQSEADLKAEGEKQTALWQKSAQEGFTVHGAFVQRTSVSPASDVVGKDLKVGESTFLITVNGTATAYTVPGNEPRSTAISRLSKELEPGMELDPRSAVVDTVIPPVVKEDGVYWRVRARAQQYARPQLAQMKAALAGRPLQDTAEVVRPLGFEVQRITPWPDWWPRLPVLDLRINIDITPATSAGSP